MDWEDSLPLEDDPMPPSQPDLSRPAESSSPAPSLTIEHILKELPKIKTGYKCLIRYKCLKLACFLVTTPNINSRLALPVKNRPVENSSQFRDIWSLKKTYVTQVSGVGRGGTYMERKQQRMSEEFPWPSLQPVPEVEEGVYIFSFISFQFALDNFTQG